MNKVINSFLPFLLLMLFAGQLLLGCIDQLTLVDSENQEISNLIDLDSDNSDTDNNSDSDDENEVDPLEPITHTEIEINPLVFCMLSETSEEHLFSPDLQTGYTEKIDSPPKLMR